MKPGERKIHEYLHLGTKNAFILLEIYVKQYLYIEKNYFFYLHVFWKVVHFSMITNIQNYSKVFKKKR